MATVQAPVVSSPPIRFNLKTLLLVIAGVGIVLAPYQWFGGFYLFSALLSLAIVIACTLIYRSAGGVAILAAIVATFVSFMVIMASPMLFGHAILNLVLCVVLALFRVRPRTFAVATAGLAIGLYGFAMWCGYDRVRELTALQARFPMKSLEKRLDFERTPGRNTTPTASAVTIPPLVLTRLDEFEERQHYSRYNSRQWALQQLHENIYMHFASAAGFGVMRMGYIHGDVIELEPAAPLAMPAPLDTIPASPAESELSPIHSQILLEFVGPDRMGYVRSRNAVAGFESHRVTKQAEISGDGKQSTHWQVKRLELVSLLRHETPRVYTADELPAMDELAEVPHRALNTFEATALPQLETIEDVVIDQQPEQIQMLGAVRAATSCLECHEGQRGRLLGAFSYEITPLVSSDQAAN